MTPTARELQWRRDNGWTACVVEKWNMHARVRQDAFGFGDILAVQPEVIALVQVTSGDHHAERLAKIRAEPRAARWLAAGGLIEVVSWSKRKVKRGGKAVRWTRRAESLGCTETGDPP